MTGIVIVVAAWNVRDYLRTCLKSIAAETKTHPVHVVVVDNGSTDGTAEMAAAEFPGTTVLRNEKNAGFVAGTNRGLRWALGEGTGPADPRPRADYLLLLNADIVIRDGALDRLADFLDARPDAAAAAPGLVLPDGRRQTGPAGFAPTAASAWSYFSFAFMLRPARSRPLFVPNRVSRTASAAGRRVDWLSGACLMVRASVVRAVGLMDESFFIYADDIDWGVRMARAGANSYFLPKIEVVHYHGVTAKTIHREINTRWLQRLFQYVRRDRGAFEAFLFRLIAAGGFALRAMIYGLGCLVPRFKRSAPRLGPKAREMAAFALFSLRSGAKRG